MAGSPRELCAAIWARSDPKFESSSSSWAGGCGSESAVLSTGMPHMSKFCSSPGVSSTVPNEVSNELFNSYSSSESLLSAALPPNPPNPPNIMAASCASFGGTSYSLPWYPRKMAWIRVTALSRALSSWLYLASRACVVESCDSDSVTP